MRELIAKIYVKVSIEQKGESFRLAEKIKMWFEDPQSEPLRSVKWRLAVAISRQQQSEQSVSFC